jgi:Fe-S cluster assembly iron-binding protein IscA
MVTFLHASVGVRAIRTLEASFFMLQMTDRAADLLRNLRDDAQLPQTAGVRVYSETAPTGEPTLSIGFTPEPMPSDLVSDHSGLRLFVAPDIAEPLSGAVMDVIAEDGESQLIFRPAEIGTDGTGEASLTQ